MDTTGVTLMFEMTEGVLSIVIFVKKKKKKKKMLCSNYPWCQSPEDKNEMPNTQISRQLQCGKQDKSAFGQARP